MATKSQFFRVATEGATTDGRNIDRATIEQLAASYNPKTYGARIWLEHIRGILPDSQFKAYGDVIAVKAEEVDTDNGKKLALFAQIEPTPELVAINKAKQKLYSSLEIAPDFADTGMPYLVGLGVTDSPASLGTDALKFSANRKQQSTNLFSAAVEVELVFDEPAGVKLADAMKNLLSRFSTTTGSNAAQFADISEAVQELAGHVVTVNNNYADTLKRLDAAEKAQKATQDELATFKAQMDEAPGNGPRRPSATGNEGAVQTEF
ncbi:GPO family capsid scaffolding protein [Janthinobacterium sp. SUN073]|uniref:GPO family capsid scaffolding protein n=1 Tax=Janthinobacterium sp. SUN073 TaxID=3004102 RepID=UPI0025B27330|nr:GPO family capsid scaffolding protein [Janthinobacterium sp. SUN073]MDN2699306.1 GPO family capsid scaffolding protein [Janthinobacterium sp. SUN073]